MNSFKSDRRKQRSTSTALNATSTFGAPEAGQTPQEQDTTGLHAGHSLADFTVHYSGGAEAATPIQKVDEKRGQRQSDRPEQALSEERQENRTGLPDSLKAGVENLSGYSLDDIRVHYNSSKPAEVQALAYTQGTEIHVGPGQEQHLAHEAWHVVQQKQGRVQATRQMKGVAINDDEGLEKEADVMGERAMQVQIHSLENVSQLRTSDSAIVQRVDKKRKAGEVDEEDGEDGEDESSDVLPPRKSGRVSRPSKETWFQQMPTHFVDPSYTAVTDARAGGKYSVATLSPTCIRGMGSDADSNLPDAIVPARAKYPTAFFKAGHLLNADFFGDGQDPANLTILTGSANTSMTTFDNNVKYAVETLKRLYSALYDDRSKLWSDVTSAKCGIKVEVSVSDEKWHDTDYPDICIAKEVYCKATLVNETTLPKNLTTSQQKILEQVKKYIEAANGCPSVKNNKPVTDS